MVKKMADKRESNAELMERCILVGVGRREDALTAALYVKRLRGSAGMPYACVGHIEL